MHYDSVPIGSSVTLRGPDVRLKRYLDTLGFTAVRIDNPGAPTEMVMRRDTGPLLPVLRLVHDETSPAAYEQARRSGPEPRYQAS